MDDAYVSYDGDQDGKEKECNGTGPSGDAQQETHTRTEEGDCTKGSREKVGQVYFIETEDGQFVKIGFSSNVVRRVGQLGTLMPVRLLGYFPGSRSTERLLHSRFAADHKIGEWFISTPALREFISEVDLTRPVVRCRTEPTSAKVPAEKNEFFMALAQRRMKTMTAEERAEVARQGGKASKAKLTPEQRSEIARKAGLAGGRGRKKAK